MSHFLVCNRLLTWPNYTTKQEKLFFSHFDQSAWNTQLSLQSVVPLQFSRIRMSWRTCNRSLSTSEQESGVRGSFCLHKSLFATFFHPQRLMTEIGFLLNLKNILRDLSASHSLEFHLLLDSFVLCKFWRVLLFLFFSEFYFHQTSEFPSNFISEFYKFLKVKISALNCIKRSVTY